MKAAHPKLITFSISHFCEKARWGLDWHGLAYEEVRWPIGLHRVLAKFYGARSSTLPILLNDGAVLQGSSEIIDWADDQIGSGSKRRLTVRGAREIEQRADSVLGMHVRRLCYSEMLSHSSSSVRTELFRGLSTTQQLIGNVMWPVTRRLMMQAMDIPPGSAVGSRAIVEFELDWLDSLLDCRPYLAGDTFSRADIAVASLLAPLARPKQMATFHKLHLPTPLMNDVRRWRERPIMRWVRLNYHKQRNFMPTSERVLNSVATAGVRMSRISGSPKGDAPLSVCPPTSPGGSRTHRL